MRTFKLTVEYDGSRYHGWQDQLNARTIQGEIKEAAASIAGGIVDVQGAGRTDAGVHALGQVAHLKTKRTLSAAELIAGLNDKLPADIVVLSAEEMHLNFHARHDASTRTYLYQITTRKTAFAKKFVWWIKQPLNVAAMSEAAKLLVGRHDFSLFAQKDPSKPGESTIVVVDKAEVEVDEHLILFRIEASHFLWRMVRRIVGVLARVGSNELTPSDLGKLLAGEVMPGFDIAAATAPASGLFLESVAYADPVRAASGARPASAPTKKTASDRPRRSFRDSGKRR